MVWKRGTCRVPEGYLKSEAEAVRRLRERVVAAGEDQVVIDDVI